MPRSLPIVYWDAAAWIAYIRKELPTAENGIKDPRHQMCKETLRRAAESFEIEIATSAFSLAEVCKRRSEPSDPSINLPAFFNQPYVILVPLDNKVGLKAQNLQLSGIGNLKPADATHLASALVHSIPVFHTFDEGLIKLDHSLTCDDGSQLRIVKPGEEIPKPPMLEAMEDGSK